MKTKKILIVDDEPDLCEIVRFNLHTAGYEAESVLSAEEALQKDTESYDLFLLDVMMEGISGFELAAKLKAKAETCEKPIIFLTAKDTEADLLTGFDIGTDDYIAKPFSVREMLARVKAVLNRSTNTSEENDDLIIFKGLTMNPKSKTLTIDGEPSMLTKTEFELLQLFLTHREKVLTRQEIIDQVWPKDVVVTDRTVDVNITRMRKKLGNYSACIVSRQGYGYIYFRRITDKHEKSSQTF
ncbi:MAG: response regulator transcription factor [Bacteroidaceae bacterium]|nr:response regulator transcription factor [Bacteroidaceae bacterium]